jgi:iron(III) transport system ATP-binding protein
MAHLALPDGDGQVLHVHARLPPGVVLRRGEAVSLLADPERAFAFPLGGEAPA